MERDATPFNMAVLWEYIEKNGRMVDVCTDRESMFILPRRKWESEQERQAADRLTQLGRSLREPGIGSIPANSPQAKGRVERSFLTAQDRLGPVAQRLEQRTHNLTLPFKGSGLSGRPAWYFVAVGTATSPPADKPMKPTFGVLPY